MTAATHETPAASGSEPAGRGRRLRGWQVIARKELADHVRSPRLFVVVGLLALSGVGAVVAAAGSLQSVAEQASGDAAIFLRLFAIEIGGTPFAFTSLVTLIGPLLGVAFGFDAINAERSERTLPRLVAQPIHRDDVIVGKFVAGLAIIGLVVVALTLVTGAIGVLRLGVVPSAGELARLLVWLVVTVCYVALWLAFAIACSVFLHRSSSAAVVALAVWVVLSLFSTFLIGLIADTIAPLPADPAGVTVQQVQANADVERLLSSVVPGSVYSDATSALLTPEVRSLGFSLSSMDPRAIPSSLSLPNSLSIVWPQVVGLLAATVALFGVAYVRFMREELRA